VQNSRRCLARPGEYVRVAALAAPRCDAVVSATAHTLAARSEPRKGVSPEHRRILPSVRWLTHNTSSGTSSWWGDVARAVSEQADGHEQASQGDGMLRDRPKGMPDERLAHVGLDTSSTAGRRWDHHHSPPQSTALTRNSHPHRAVPSSLRSLTGGLTRAYGEILCEALTRGRTRGDTAA